LGFEVAVDADEAGTDEFHIYRGVAFGLIGLHSDIKWVLINRGSILNANPKKANGE
jgi:hypothetical protein